MSCEVAALPFQANTNYGTWSINFDLKVVIFSYFLKHTGISLNLVSVFNYCKCNENLVNIDQKYEKKEYHLKILNFLILVIF